MTISYSGNFFKILLRWKGSLWKAVWLELVLFLIIYFLISLIYRFALDENQRISFEAVAVTFDEYTERIPITFLLGFYIAAVVKRWWEQFNWVAWPDDILTFVCVIIPGVDADSIQKRRTVARWLVLTAALCWRDISIGVRRRFPTVEHLVWSGLMTDDELVAHNKVVTPTTKWCLPLQWIMKVIQAETARLGTPGTPPIMSQFIREINKYRACFRMLYCYDWVCIPLVYTQVAALATYGYFVLCLVGRQYLDPEQKIERHRVDLYFPIFTVMQFFFYVGWFKVGQYLMRPFEEDDDDIELNYMLDRHIQASFSIVDELTKIDMPTSADRFLLDPVPNIPYTRASSKRQQHPPKLHAKLKLKCSKDHDITETFLPPEARHQRKGTIIRQF